MPVVVARKQRRFLTDRLRHPRKRLTTSLWILLGLLILYSAYVKLKEVTREAESDAESDTDPGYATHEQRVAWLMQYQAQKRRPPPVVKLTIYDVCSTTCGLTNSSVISKGIPLDVVHIPIDAKSVTLDEPPIPIIGTDQEHRRIVSGWDVAEFVAHVRVWRAVFHGDGGIGIFLNCRVKDPLPVLKALRADNWFRNETEGGTMGKDEWDILLLGAGTTATVPTGPVLSRVVTVKSIAERDLLGYALSKRGANRLLSYVRAYTVPIMDFVSVVLEKDIKMLMWPGAGLGEVEDVRCGSDKGVMKDSTLLPFYPPVHWIHAAARDKS